MKSYTLLMKCKNSTTDLEKSLQFLRKLNIQISYDPAISLLDIDPKELKAISQRYLYTHVRSSIIHSSQHVEAAQVSVDT